MAKFTPGPLSGEIRGSVGAVTFSRNRFGAYMRVRVKPTVSTTIEATAAKARMTAATQAWQTWTENQRLAWNQFANANPITGSLGEANILTGHVASVGINVRRLILGSALLDTPPITPAPAPLTSVTADIDGTLSNADFTFSAAPLGATERIWLTCCQQPSAGKYWVENILKGGQFSGVAQASPWGAIGIVEARIGTLVVGDYFHALVAVIDTATGLVSAPLRLRQIIV